MTDRTESLQPERWPQAASPYSGSRRTEPRATAALVFGVLSVTLLPIIGPFLALFYGVSREAANRELGSP